MILEGPFPDGGYGDPKLYTSIAGKLLLNRCPARSFETSDIIRICERNLHSRINTVRMSYNEEVQKTKDALNLTKTATLWFATPKEIVEDQNITLGTVPYMTTMTKVWNEDTNRWSPGEMYIGWRGLLTTFVANGVLRASDELTWLIGERTCQIQQRKFRT